MQMKNIREISIVLPVFNEGKSIERQIKLIEESVFQDHEILIIYDFNGDNTIEAAKRSQKKYKNIFLFKNLYGRGLIGAIKTGFKKSLGSFVVVMPADLADDPRTINKMYDKTKEGYEIVCATRYAGGGAKIGGPYLKTLLSRAAGLATPLLLGINTTDIANGFKMYKREILEKIKIESSGGWEFSMEIVIKAHNLGFRISEVPTIWKDRVFGKSKFKLLKWLPKYMKWYLLGICWRLNINRRVL